MEYEIRPLADALGAEVVGFDLRRDAEVEAVNRLNPAWIDHVVLCFRDQDIEPGGFLRLASIFGDTVRDVLRREEYEVAGFPTIRLLSSEHLDTLGDGKPLRIGGSWHTDHSHMGVPPRGTMLHALELPAHGGDTCFTNQRAAYDALSDTMKARIEPLRAVHVYNSKYSPRRLAKPDPREAAALPSAAHPLARRHPVSGRKAIYLNPVRTEVIEGMNEVDSQHLLAELLEHSTQERFVYRHRWRRGDVLIWDNRQALHMALHDYRAGARRRMHRVMVAGP